MKNIFGSIGYTLLNNKNNILIFADKHDDIPDCENKINMAEWLKTKFNSSIILLEEIPRFDSKILELWEMSIHTKELKEVYLKYPTIIKPIDIRHLLLEFSWELVDDDPKYDISFLKYIQLVNKCLILENSYLKQNCKLYDAKLLSNTTLGEHFITIRKDFFKLYMTVKKKKILNNNIKYFVDNYTKYLFDFNNLISDLMEWYICACICENNNKPLIIHIGLAHSEKIIQLLQSTYSYKIIEQQGINTLDELETKEIKGCVQISEQLNNQFGGYVK